MVGIRVNRRKLKYVGWKVSLAKWLKELKLEIANLIGLPAEAKLGKAMLKDMLSNKWKSLSVECAWLASF